MRIVVKGLQEGEYAAMRRNGGAWEIFIKDNLVSQVPDGAVFKDLGLDKYRLIGIGNDEARVIRFADLHRHSDCSLLDGMTKISDMVEKTEYAGALTDHGAMYGFLEYYKSMNAAGKKPIIGFEGYIESLDGQLNGRHIILLAKNDTGVKNLFKLTSGAYDNFKRKPHVTWEMLSQYHEGVICLSACLAGIIPTALLKKQEDVARAAIEKFISIFGKEDFFIEIQRHYILEEDMVRGQLVSLAKEYGLKIVATSDAHYPSKEDAYTHEVLLCLQTGKTMDDPNHLKYDGEGYYLMNSEEMEELFKDFPEALDTSLEIAERCNIDIKLNDVNMPKYAIPEPFKTMEEYFEHLVHKGFKRRFKGTVHENDPVYKERFDYELNMIKQMGFEDYFVVVWDFINYARTHNIYVGPGRGSAAGSIIAYCLGITDLDPIKYNLLFERFLNPERVSMPDVDTDIEYSKRPEVINYITRKYGAENVCHIVTFGSLAAKQAVKDVGRCLGMPASYNAHLSSMIPQEVGMTIEKALNNSPDFKNAYESDANAKRIIDIAQKLEGNKRHASQHACFDKDTYITTKQGLKKIIDVVPGDEVLTHKGRFKPVVDTMVTQTDKVYNVKFYGAADIRVTGNHPLYVRHQYKKKTKTVNGTKTAVRCYTEPKWTNVSELGYDDYVCVPVNSFIGIPSVAKSLPVNLPEFWWIVGRYVSNGYLEHRTHSNHLRIGICCGKKRQKKSLEVLLNKIQACGFDYSVSESQNQYLVFILHNPELCKYLTNYGCRAADRRLAGDVFNLPLNMIEAFIDGFFTGDKAYDEKRQRYSLISISKELVLGLMQCVNKLYHTAAGFCFKPAQETKFSGETVSFKDAYRSFFCTASKPKQRFFYEDGCIWVRFKSMTVEDKEQPMYNLTVLDDSSYMANGIAAHNCGLVLSPNPVSDFLPTSMEIDDQTQEKSLTSQVIMTEVEELSLIKMDLLGLKNLGVIHEVIDRIQENYGKEAILKQIGSNKSKIEYQDIPLTDRETYKMMAQGLTGGVFQMEGEGMTKLIGQMLEDIDTLPDERLEECFERLIAAVALYRPGPMDYIPNYIAGMQDVHNIHYLTPELESLLKPTYGVIVYQEQVMQIVQKLAGYSLARADLVRKAMGKKKQKIMDAEKAVFIYGNKEAFESGKDTAYAPGCVANGIPEAVAQEIWAQMADFAKYAFNRSHAACYAYIAYITAYMSCHWTEEFYAALLNAFIENSDKVKSYLSQAAHRNIHLLPPDINLSGCNFKAEKSNIRFGLQGISGVKSVAKVIIAEREANGQFESLQSLYERMADRDEKLNKRAFEGLVYAGALNDLCSNKAAMLAYLPLLEANYKYFETSRKTQQPTLFPMSFLQVDMPDVPVIPEKEELQKEYETLGMYLSKHPTDSLLQNLASSNNYVPLEDLATMKETRKCIQTVGLIKNYRKFYTKASKEMCTFTLETKFASLSVVVFPDTFRDYSTMLIDNTVIGINGDLALNNQDNNMQIIVREVLPEYSLVKQAVKPIVVTVNNKTEQDNIIEFIKQHPGQTPVHLEHNSRIYPLKIGVNVTPSVVEYFKSIKKVS